MTGIRVDVQRWMSVSVVGAALAVSGCSAAQPPVASVARAEMAIRQAGESPAPQHASAELRVAREKLLAAQKAMDDDDYEEARRLAEQATVDAQLAQAKASSAETQQQAAELRKTIDALREEAVRSSVTP
jgi:Domain of unknown function (DUF4398)